MDRKTQATSSIYDALNRLTTVTYADGSSTTFTYDAGNRLTEIVDSVAGTIARTFDGLDRLATETTPQGGVSYTYDAAGRRTGLTVAGQPAVTYTYDAADRLTSVTQGTAAVGFAYDTANRRTQLTLPNGTSTEYAYDAASRLTALTYKAGSAVLGTLTYTYDAAGNRAGEGGTWARTGLPTAVSSATYNAANQQLTFGNQTLTYDLNGNLLNDGVNTYTWNARNELVAINGPVLASFAYDGVGRRRMKTIVGTTTSFVHDGVNPVQEQSGTAVALLLTGLGIDEFFTRSDSTGTQTYFASALGSTVAMVDGIGAIQATYVYEAFGATTVTGTTANTYDYTGRETDGTGLKFYRARYYHPGLQRFVSEDPLGFSGGDANLYAYVMNSPIKLADPLGLSVVQHPWCQPPSPPGKTKSSDGSGDSLGQALGDALKAFACDPNNSLPGPGVLRGPSSGMIRQFEKQLAEHGARSLERSLRSFERLLAEHLKKLEAIEAAGGDAGSVAREIRNFRRLIEAIDRVRR